MASEPKQPQTLSSVRMQVSNQLHNCSSVEIIECHVIIENFGLKRKQISKRTGKGDTQTDRARKKRRERERARERFVV